MTGLLHQSARLALESFMAEVSELFPDLVSVIAYGSAVAESFQARHSNINVLVVLPKVDPAALERAARLHKHRSRHRITPMFLSEAEVRDSTDVFAVELSDLKARHVLLKGVDVLESLEIPPVWLRRQCEFELRSKLLRLRQGYIECEGRSRPLEDLMVLILGGLLPLGRSLLRLQGEKPHARRSEQLAAVALAYKFEAGPFLEVLELKERMRSRPARPTPELYRGFLESLESLVRQVNDAS